MILAAPPVAAIANVNPSSGLDPSVYGGGGSVSSKFFPDASPLVSSGKGAFISASTVEETLGGWSTAVGVKAGGAEGSGSVTTTFADSGGDEGKSEENGGGLESAQFEDEANVGPG